MKNALSRCCKNSEKPRRTSNEGGKPFASNIKEKKGKWRSFKNAWSTLRCQMPNAWPTRLIIDVEIVYSNFQRGRKEKKRLKSSVESESYVKLNSNFSQKINISLVYPLLPPFLSPQTKKIVFKARKRLFIKNL